MVERAAEPRTSALRRQIVGAARALTTPLVPDDYLGLLNPAWSARELTGTVDPAQARDASRRRPSSCGRASRGRGTGPGQYLRIGAELNGIRHWRAYSLTSRPRPSRGAGLDHRQARRDRADVAATSRAGIEPGAMVFLGDVEGEFRLPDPLPERSLFISAGSGVTPIWAMLRELERRGALRRRDPHPLRPRARPGHLRRRPAADERAVRRLHAASST